VTARFVPEAVPLRGSLEATVVLECHNAGRGLVECRLQDEQPAGLSPAPGQSSAWIVPPQQRVEVAFTVDPSRLEEGAATVAPRLLISDGVGRHRHDFRAPSLEKTWREAAPPLRLDRMRLGPFHLYQEMLLIRRRDRPRKLLMKNKGQVSLNLTLSVPPESGYQLRQATRAGAFTLSLEVQPEGTHETVYVEVAPPGAGRPAAPRPFTVLRVEVREIPRASRDVLLAWLPEGGRGLIEERWVVGIDFGTANTAIYVTDAHLYAADPLHEDARPRPVKWTVRAEQRVTVPSVILYPPRGLPRFGWNVPASAVTDDDELVIRSLKKRLADPNDSYRHPNGKLLTADRIVTDFVGFLIEQVRQQLFQGEAGDPLGDARIVMSLPVHEDPQQHELQMQRTLQAALAAGLRQDQIEFYPEPECAAVDFLRRRHDLGLAVQDGELLCVFDCGAGTTDLCILQVHLSGAEVSFTPKALTGFPLGGDVVDELLTGHMLRTLEEAHALESYVEADGTYKLRGADETVYKRSDLLLSLRDLKEGIPLRGSPEDTVQWQPGKPASGIKPIPITWELIEKLFTPWLEKMLEEGFRAGDLIPDWSPEHPEGRPMESELTSAHEQIAEAGVRPNAVRWLCLTGGSSLMPFLVQRLKQLFPLARPIPDPETLAAQSEETDPPFLLNVVQGAATRPLCRITGTLPVDLFLQLEWGPEDSVQRSREFPVLERGTAPGRTSRQRQFELPAGYSGALRVIARAGEHSGVLYSLPIERSPQAPDSNVQATLRYEASRSLKLTATLAGPGEHRDLAKDEVVLESEEPARS
jgi:hypothetical protein